MTVQRYGNPVPELPPEELDRIAEVVQQGPYEGYPANKNRLFSDRPGFQAYGSMLVVPSGPWHISRHPNRRGVDPNLLDPEVPSPDHAMVSGKLLMRWCAQGLAMDQLGRPVHPNWQQLLADKRIGLPTGLGFFYRYGPNGTVDPIVYRQASEHNPREFLLIKRKKGGRWALPGGFLDRSDASFAAAARREAGEETGLTDVGGSDEVIMHKRPVGLRDTLNAWTENAVVLIHGRQDYLFDVKPVASDDAEDVGWFTPTRIGELALFDAHAQYLGAAMQRLAERER